MDIGHQCFGREGYCAVVPDAGQVPDKSVQVRLLDGRRGKQLICATAS